MCVKLKLICTFCIVRFNIDCCSLASEGSLALTLHVPYFFNEPKVKYSWKHRKRIKC